MAIFEETRAWVEDLAFHANNEALRKAISFSETWDDLEAVAKQTHGPGSQKIKTLILGALPSKAETRRGTTP